MLFLPKSSDKVVVSFKCIIKEKENDHKFIIWIAAYLVQSYFPGKAYMEIEGYDLNVFHGPSKVTMYGGVLYIKAVSFSTKALNMVHIYTHLFSATLSALY